MRIRTKLLALIAVPVLAISLAAAIGFAAQSRAIETAESSAESVNQANAIYDAIVTIGAERLVVAGADNGQSLAEIREASDMAVATLADQGLTELATELTEDLESARQTQGSDAFAVYSDINTELLGVPGDTADRYPNAVSRDAAVINRLAVESLEMREKAWLSYMAADVADLPTATSLAGFFANAQMGVTHTSDFANSPRMDAYLTTAPAQRLNALETVALDDLKEEQLSVSDDEALDALVGFRTGWANIVDQRTDELGVAIDDELAGANDLRSLFSLLAAVGVVVGAGLIFVIYRSITTPLNSLLERAGQVANEDLPNLVTTLRDSENDAELPTAEVIPMTSNDEIGELVAAFNNVQVTAYDLATEQALGRRAVGEMFVNLGRRNQQLLERILVKLTDLQQEEEDPATLASLFELDNIITRMRRNAESLLVMAGATTPRQWSQSVDIENTVRAAFGEVEGYQRIDIAALAPADLRGNVVADVAHLLAELLENAIHFSDNNSSVLVSGQVERSTYVLNIFDQGIGMTADELELNNSRITDPPPLDQVPTKFLGLYVVGRLADRHGIKVRLGDAPGGGVLARVELPEAVMAKPESTPADASSLNAALAMPALASDSESAADPDAEFDDLAHRFDMDAELASLADDDADEQFQQSDLQRRFAATHESGGDSEIDHDDLDETVAEHHVAEADSGDALESMPTPEPKAIEPDSGFESETAPEPVSDSEPISENETTLPIVDTASFDTASADTAHQTSSSQLPSLPRRSISETESTTPTAKPETGGLPVRARGQSLETANPLGSLERRGPSVEDVEEPVTDNSPEGAGNFSSMMSALSSGISRGLQDSQSNDTDSPDNDRNQES